MIATPAYLFDAAAFADRTAQVRQQLGEGIPLTYAVKANPFLLHALPAEIAHLEVCSPGELQICRRLGIAPDRILYSGVVKREADLREALAYGVQLVTVESPAQLQLLRRLHPADRRIDVLLRLSSGNQFGMDAQTLLTAARDMRSEAELRLAGIHYYSGTQKKTKQITADLEKLRSLLARMEGLPESGPFLIEYGPGLSACCFAEDTDACEEKDRETFAEVLPLLRQFAEDWPLGIELGRFLAAPAGRYLTTVTDLKDTEGVRYVLVDGGTHHLRYHGQMLGMQTPVITVSGGEDARKGEAESPDAHPRRGATICGSLCTVSDVLARNVTLPEIAVGDRLTFARCGAYSVTEAPALFLSRSAPSVWLRRADGQEICLRPERETADWNGGDAG